MKQIAALLIAMTLVGCASTQAALKPTPACPTGQQHRVMAQMYFGRDKAPKVSVSAFKTFVDTEITARFPDAGVTVLEGGGQWAGPEDGAIREAARVVVIVLPRSPGVERRLDAVRKAYMSLHPADTAAVRIQDTCVTL